MWRPSNGHWWQEPANDLRHHFGQRCGSGVGATVTSRGVAPAVLTFGEAAE